MRLAAAGALLWTLAALAQIPLGGLEATGAGTALNVWDVAMGGALGRLQMLVAVLAALATLAYALARSTVLACWGLAFAGLGTLSLGLVGHAGASLDHINAVNAMARTSSPSPSGRAGSWPSRRSPGGWTTRCSASWSAATRPGPWPRWSRWRSAA
ncbi:hypothetical protein [Brachybacterium sp. GPGPB12]|uniref:hypothetical protein n=1 Tax=Brachybacterium sp. GPGPB12 TaxID=3023517 RepID=UPI0031344D8A